MDNAQAAVSSAPVFVLSCQRSGSTLLRYIIDTHPEICSPAELHLGRLCEDLIHVADLLSVGEVAGTTSRAERNRRVNEEVRRMVSRLMDTYARGKGKRLWCEKTPGNLAHLDVLKGVFPDAKFICLHRNCMDVVHSCLGMEKMGLPVEMSYYTRNIPTSFTNHVCVFADSWADKTEKLLRFERENPEQCFRMKYESLVADPEGALGPMFDFIGVGWDPALLDAVFTSQHDPGPGDRKVMYSKKVQKNVGGGSSVPRDMLTEALLGKINQLLGQLEYPLVGPDWNTAPSPYLAADAGREDEDGGQLVSGAGELFTAYFPRRLKAAGDKLPGLGQTYKFVVTGEGGGVWLIDLTRPGGRITPGEGEASCVITVSADDLVSMANGKLNAARAFELGKFRVAGDTHQVAAFGQVLLGA